MASLHTIGLEIEEVSGLLLYKFPLYIIIGAELGGAAGARAPPLLHNPRNFIV